MVKIDCAWLTFLSSLHLRHQIVVVSEHHKEFCFEKTTCWHLQETEGGHQQLAPALLLESLEDLYLQSKTRRKIAQLSRGLVNIFGIKLPARHIKYHFLEDYRKCSFFSMTIPDGNCVSETAVSVHSMGYFKASVAADFNSQSTHLALHLSAFRTSLFQSSVKFMLFNCKFG